MSDPVVLKQGWFFPENSKKAHYIRDGRSLCRKWGCFSYNAISDKPYVDADTCKECLRLRQREALNITHGCHECGKPRLPRTVAGKLTCPECGSDRIVPVLRKLRSREAQSGKARTARMGNAV